MERPPSFQFYARDWLSSTMGMPWDVKGVYIDLLAWSWDNGPLPADPKWRENMIGMDAKRLWSAVRPRWRKTSKGWVNLRLELQRDTQANFREHAKKAAKTRWAPKSSMLRAYAQGHAQLMLDPEGRASVEHMPEQCSSSSSSSSDQDQDQPAASRPVSTPTFKTYAAIAIRAMHDEPSADLGAIAERFKVLCAKQGYPYDATITTKALSAASAARARRRA